MSKTALCSEYNCFAIIPGFPDKISPPESDGEILSCRNRHNNHLVSFKKGKRFYDLPKVQRLFPTDGDTSAGNTAIL